MGDSEVYKFHGTGGQNHDVARLDVPMDYLALMCIAQSLADFNENRELFDEVQRLAGGEDRVQAAALQVLHRQVGISGVVPEFVDRNDIGMLQAGR